MKRLSISICLLILIFLPSVSAVDYTASRAYIMPNECPAGHSVFLYFSGYYSFSNRTFDSATLTHLNYMISSTQNGTVTILAVQEGTGYNKSYYPIWSFGLGAGESVTLNESHFGLSDWSGIPESDTWQSYYNLTHYQLVTYSYIKLPFFIIEFENTGIDHAIVVSELSTNVTFSGFRDLESVFIPKNSTWIPVSDSPIVNWWGDYWPSSGNILIDGLFLKWLNDQDYDESEWYAFYYDPTQFFSYLFEMGIVLGIVVGIIVSMVAVWFGLRRLG